MSSATLAGGHAGRLSQNVQAATRLTSQARRRKHGFKLTVRPELLAALTGYVGGAPPRKTPSCAECDSTDVIDAFIKDLARRRTSPANASELSSPSAPRDNDSAMTETQPRSRRAGNLARPGSGRVATARSFKLDSGVFPDPRRLCPSSDPTSHNAHRSAEEERPPPATKTTKKKAVSVTMRVVKRPRRGQKVAAATAVVEEEREQHTPIVLRKPSPRQCATPAPPSSMKAHGCWYVDHAAQTPTPAPGRSYSTPSTLLKAPGCWYVDHPSEGTETPKQRKRTWAAPSTQIKAKGCWYMDPEATPASVATPRTAPRPPLSSLREARVLAAAPAGDSSAEPSRSARKRKAVNFENVATPSALPRLLQSYGSTGGRSQQRPPRGVLTNLRNTYDAATPVPETAKAASQWRVEFGDGLSPYSFSPVPLRMDACEAASEDMDLDDDMDETQNSPTEKEEAGDSCGMGGTAGEVGHSRDISTQCSTPSIAAASEPKTPSAARNKGRRKSVPNQRLRRASACALTPGINRAGTKMVDGVRRSSRQSYQPLEYWRNEHKEYARCLSSMPTVVKIATRTPDPTPRRKKAKANRKASKAHN